MLLAKKEIMGVKLMLFPWSSVNFQMEVFFSWGVGWRNFSAENVSQPSSPQHSDQLCQEPW